MRRIAISAGMLIFAGSAFLGATGAFFSDTETSTGNTFTAGDIDLQIDNHSFASATSTQGAGPSNLVLMPGLSWDLKDLVPGVDHFFDFNDVKPGDVGEDTISIHVGSNNAWMCAAARITADNDVTYTDPEVADDPTVNVGSPSTTDGELDSVINFAFWHDDGDNVFETTQGDVVGTTTDGAVFLSGPLSGLGQQGKITLADSQSSILGGTTPIPGGTTFYIGKIWCAGTLTPAPVAQDGLGRRDAPNDNSPLVRGTGWLCNGAPVNNASQTDTVKGDMQFFAVQSRNNPTFTCAAGYTPFGGAISKGSLTVIKHVVHAAAGDAAITAANFSIHVASSTEAAGSPQPGAESPGTTYSNLTPGSYTVSETGAPATPAGETLTTTFTGDCNAVGLVSVVGGASRTCTITNTYQAVL